MRSFLFLFELSAYEPDSSLPLYTRQKVREPTKGSVMILNASAEKGASSVAGRDIAFSASFMSTPGGRGCRGVGGGWGGRGAGQAAAACWGLPVGQERPTAGACCAGPPTPRAFPPHFPRRPRTLHVLNVQGRGQVVDDRVEQRLHALVLEGRAAQHGHELAVDGALAQEAADGGLVGHGALKVSLQDLVGGGGGGRGGGGGGGGQQMWVLRRWGWGWSCCAPLPGARPGAARAHCHRPVQVRCRAAAPPLVPLPPPGRPAPPPHRVVQLHHQLDQLLVVLLGLLLHVLGDVDDVKLGAQLLACYFGGGGTLRGRAGRGARGTWAASGARQRSVLGWQPCLSTPQWLDRPLLNVPVRQPPHHPHRSR
jgi:hypothetical protein